MFKKSTLKFFQGALIRLGIVTNFETRSQNDLNIDTWRKILDNRLDVGIFHMTIDKSTVTGSLKEDIFKENIEDFINVFSAITGSDSIDYSFRKHGTKRKLLGNLLENESK
jgi:hypothetical protein